MSRRHEQADAALEALYARIPVIPDCDGRCWTTCGAISMSSRERQRIRAAGTVITPWREAVAKPETHWCEALTGDKRCGVYRLRPVVCRLAGAVESLKCPYGCVPEGGWLSAEDGVRLLNEAALACGDPEGIDRAALERAMTDPGMRTVISAIYRQGQAAEQARTGLAVPAAFRRGRGQDRPL